MSDGNKRTRKLAWVVVWLALFVITVIVGYPAGQSGTYFGWWPANHLEMSVVALLGYAVYLVYFRDVMFNINPIDSDDIQPIETQTSSASRAEQAEGGD